MSPIEYRNRREIECLVNEDIITVTTAVIGKG
jgi:hypothetical protein